MRLANERLRKRYLVIKSLGSGGFGETFLAKDTLAPQTPLCVVKRLKRSPFPHRITLFETEAQTLYQLGRLTSQIPALLDHFVEDQIFYLVQEYIEGQTLADRLQQKWHPQELIHFLQQVLTVLQFLHSHQIIHGDIKPRNLIRRPDGQWALIDFGAVKLTDSIEPVVTGTIGYMPNEQQAGRSRYSSDIYALGMVAVQCLTGVHPKYWHEDLETGEILWKAKLNSNLKRILQKMTKVRLRDRYTSATEVLMDLNRLHQGQNKKYLPNILLTGCVAFILLAVIIYCQKHHRPLSIEVLQGLSILIPIGISLMLTHWRLW
jgi:eukaryotic-like serine/threonine-protein kinase